MEIQSTYIYLRNLRFHALHGVLPQERVTGNDYELTLRIGYPMEGAMLSDAVAETLNYAEVYQLVKEEMRLPCNLMERVARRISDRLLRQFPEIRSIDLWLTKKNPPMGADCEGTGVEVHLINDKTK
ncbi:dihydroneopterin aldolase [Prevotella sp. oral taxon 376]|uniref:dihydroneopterin aldolase n=1 Tax=Prevotella sp. oral taxon 376 TaxID=712466 RepID=UPI000D1FCC9E|nr:dihydroneopterin aldolase [Prevotella sp. oral taxon 376]PTL33078.1 dihydroneopterin aldolase [Prevotella sp. oral taxon 376]